MDNGFILGLLAWAIPGYGHIQLGYWQRGLIIAGCFWSMFIIAIVSGGAYYPGFEFKDGSLLYILNMLGRCGSGLGALLSWFLGSNPPVDFASWATFEYGGRFLEIAGLVNYLAVIDVLDLHARRKQ